MHRKPAAQDAEQAERAEERRAAAGGDPPAGVPGSYGRLAETGAARTWLHNERHLQVFQPTEAVINVPLVHGRHRECGEP